MAQTPYEEKRKAFSDRAHNLARIHLYPKFFGLSPEELGWEDPFNEETARIAHMLDTDFAIDRIAQVPAPGFKRPIRFYIQERFREKHAERYQELTMTEWNYYSNTPAEVHKIAADYFVYGYVEEDTWNTRITQSVIFNMVLIKEALTKGLVPVTKKENEKRQSYIAIPFQSLREAGCVVYDYKALK